MKKQNKRKLFGLAAAGSAAAALMLTGTFAWQSISQKAVNKKVIEVNPGARLHDDWDGKKKSIYVENFTDPDAQDSAPVFVRVRLKEYMEKGKDAGNKNPDERTEVDVVTTGGDIHTPEEWAIHIPEDSDDPCHKYWIWRLGEQNNGSTVYMPTFNKNKDSLAPDINGTYENLSGANGGIPFGDHVTYANGQKSDPQDEIYDADDNDIDDGNVTIGPNVTHEAKETLTTEAVITMAEWNDEASPYYHKVGNYWVWDTDGWAYWAAPLMPDTATGLLLREVQSKNLTTKTYYGIYVEAQAATAGDWGTPAADGVDATGFHIDSLTKEAEALLDTIIRIQ